jgi:hypothetical protein
MLEKKKKDEHISMDSVYGTKCLLHVTNLILLGLVMILATISICLYYYMPVADVTKLAKETDVSSADKVLPDVESIDTDSSSMDKLEDEFYNIIVTRNVFTPNRKDWIVKAVIPKASEIPKKSARIKAKPFAGKPKKFVLHGILIAGDIKKALINNPLKGVRKEKTLYVEEGEDLDGYKVTSIEKDRIRLDWNGEEIVVLLYSGAKSNAPPQNRRNDVKKPMKRMKRIKRMKRLKADQGDVSLKKQDEGMKTLVASVVDVKESKNEQVPYVANVFDGALLNPLSMVYDSMLMPSIEDAPCDIDIVNIDCPDEEYQITRVEASGSLGIDSEAGINKKFISELPTITKLQGMFVLDDIRKAMIDNPIKGIDKQPALYVEDRGDLDTFSANFRKDKAGLNWQGDERVVTLFSVINNYKHEDYTTEYINKTIEAKELDGPNAVTAVDDEVSKKCKRIISNVFEEEPLVQMYTSCETLFMAVIEDTRMSLLNEKKEIDVVRSLGIDPEEGLNEKIISKGPAIINLHGIFIVDGIRKAMIEIPFKGIDKKKTLYIEEGDELNGCLVASIDKEWIRLDCQGEERVVAFNSTIENYKQEDHVAKGSNKTMETIEVYEENISEDGNKDNIELGGSLLVAAVDEDGMEEGTRIINVFDDVPFNLMSMAYESLFMPAMNGVKTSVPDEIQEFAETLPDLETDIIDHSDEEQRIAMVPPTDSIYDVLEEEELKQKTLSNVPTQIILKGIVIAGNIKKALVNVPKSQTSENRTLYVEEGDELEEYLVTRIESVQIRLDWQGEEMIVTFPGVY